MCSPSHLSSLASGRPCDFVRSVRALAYDNALSPGGMNFFSGGQQQRSTAFTCSASSNPPAHGERDATADTSVSRAAFCSLIASRSPQQTQLPAAMAPAATSTQWSTDFDTARRQRLFRNPPKDRTAYPTLAAAVDPHVHSFNRIFAHGGQLEEAIKDIGTKVFLDGDPSAQPEDAGQRNRLHVRIQKLFFDKSVLPAANKFAVNNRNVLPAECRERHVSYRGKLSARIEYKVNNGDWQEVVRDLGYVPIMLKVRSFPHCRATPGDANCARDRPASATSST